MRTNAHLMTSLAARWVLEVVFQALSRDAKMVAKTTVVFAQRSLSRAYDVDNSDTVNPEGKKAYTHAMEPRGTTRRKHEFACVLPTGVTICDPLSSPRRPRARHSILFEGRSRYSFSRELAVSVESNVFREDVFHILCRHYFRRRSYGSSALFYTIVARRHYRQRLSSASSLHFAIGAASALDVTMALGNTIAFPLLSSLHGFHSQVLATSFDTLRTLAGVSNVRVEKFPYLENL